MYSPHNIYSFTCNIAIKSSSPAVTSVLDLIPKVRSRVMNQVMHLGPRAFSELCAYFLPVVIMCPSSFPGFMYVPHIRTGLASKISTMH